MHFCQTTRPITEFGTLIKNNKGVKNEEFCFSEYSYCIIMRVCII